MTNHQTINPSLASKGAAHLWDPLDFVFKQLRCPLGVVYVERHKVDLPPELLLRLVGGGQQLTAHLAPVCSVV